MPPCPLGSTGPSLHSHAVDTTRQGINKAKVPMHSFPKNVLIDYVFEKKIFKVHSFLKECFARCSIGTIWWNLQLMSTEVSHGLQGLA